MPPNWCYRGHCLYPGPSQETFASDDFLAVLVPGWEWGGGRLGVSVTAGYRALRGIPIELFLMCFNFHFLLLENTDGDLLPLTHRARRRQGERCRPSHAQGTVASHPVLRLLWASVYPAVKWSWLRWPPKPPPCHSL